MVTVPYLVPTFAMLGPPDSPGGPEVTSDVLLSKKVYVSPSTNIAPAQLQRALRGFNATQVEKRTLADCIVTDDPARPGSTTSWTAALLGQSIISCRMLLTGRGPAVSYDPAVSVTRQLFLTSNFRQAHPLVTQLLESSCVRPCSRWKLLKVQQPNCLVLVPDRSDNGSDKTKLGPTRFLVTVKRLSGTSLGACGL